ncbi:MAG TPA: hypothetical protein VLC09_00700 [Polyangiaceae bacterium]|nr:hypothetical protein [Polyangiaceae bacterium]
MAGPETTTPGGGDLEAEAWIRGVLGLADLDLRLAWLRTRLAETDERDTARALDSWAARCYAADLRAREALLPMAIVLAAQRHEPRLLALRAVAETAALLHLGRLVREGPDDAPSSESEQRVPTYRKGRELTLGERRSLARRPSRLELEKLLLDPDPLVLRRVFGCTRLTEDDVVRVISQRPARQVTLATLLDCPRWLARRRVRLALALNPGCPHGIALPLLSTLPRDDLDLVVSSPGLSAPLRAVALEIVERMPPLGSTDDFVWQ